MTTDYDLIGSIMIDHVQALTDQGSVSDEIECISKRTVQYYGFNASDVEAFYQAKNDYPARFVLKNGEHRNIDGHKVAVTKLAK